MISDKHLMNNRVLNSNETVIIMDFPKVTFPVDPFKA